MKERNRIEPVQFQYEIAPQKSSLSIKGFPEFSESLNNLPSQHRVSCPRCGVTLDFNSILEWYGPSHFTCPQCQKLVHFRLVKVTRNDL